MISASAGGSSSRKKSPAMKRTRFDTPCVSA